MSTIRQVHDKMNVEDTKKIELAKAFKIEYEDRVKAFIDFICNSDFSCKQGYNQSLGLT